MGFDSLFYQNLLESGLGESYKNQKEASFYTPTLFRDRIYIYFPNSSDTPLKIALYDVSARLVVQKVLSRRPKLFVFDEKDTESLSSGVYILQVGSEDNLSSKKIIKLK